MELDERLELGTIKIANEVVAIIAGLAASEVEGVVDVAVIAGVGYCEGGIGRFGRGKGVDGGCALLHVEEAIVHIRNRGIGLFEGVDVAVGIGQLHLGNRHAADGILLGMPIGKDRYHRGRHQNDGTDQNGQNFLFHRRPSVSHKFALHRQ